MALTHSCHYSDDGLLNWPQMDTKLERISKANDQHSFVLRLWRGNSISSGWQASVEDARTGDRYGFSSLEELFAFLMQACGGEHVDSKD